MISSASNCFQTKLLKSPVTRHGSRFDLLWPFTCTNFYLISPDYAQSCKKCRKLQSTWRSYGLPRCEKLLWPPGLSWSPGHNALGPQGAEFEFPELNWDLHTGWSRCWRGKAVLRTCRTGEPPLWVLRAQRPPGNPASQLFHRLPGSTRLWMDWLCLKEIFLLYRELSLSSAPLTISVSLGKEKTS